MALVGIRVADRRQHRDLPLAVQLRNAARRRVPVQALVLGEHGAARQCELGAELSVQRVALRREHGQRVGAALEEHAYEHGLRGTDRGRRDPLFEGGEIELRGSVHREHGAEPVCQEGAAGQAGPGRERHAGLDRRQPAPGLRGGAAQEARSVETGAVAVAVAHARSRRRQSRRLRSLMSSVKPTLMRSGAPGSRRSDGATRSAS